MLRGRQKRYLVFLLLGISQSLCAMQQIALPEVDRLANLAKREFSAAALAKISAIAECVFEKNESFLRAGKCIAMTNMVLYGDGDRKKAMAFIIAQKCRLDAILVPIDTQWPNHLSESQAVAQADALIERARSTERKCMIILENAELFARKNPSSRFWEVLLWAFLLGAEEKSSNYVIVALANDYASLDERFRAKVRIIADSSQYL